MDGAAASRAGHASPPFARFRARARATSFSASATSRRAVSTTFAEVFRPAKTFTTSGRLTPASAAIRSCVIPWRLQAARSSANSGAFARWGLTAGEVTVTMTQGTLLPQYGKCQANFLLYGNDVKRRRKGAFVTWEEAVQVSGSRGALEQVRGKKTVQNWASAGRVPASALGSFLLARWKERPAERVPAQSAEAEYLNPELRQIRMFTAMVTALRRLEAQYPLGSKSPNAWRVRVAWEAMIAGAPTLLAVANWKDEDWKRIFDDGADLWKRPKAGKRSEAETLRERLQIELGFEGE